MLMIYKHLHTCTHTYIIYKLVKYQWDSFIKHNHKWRKNKKKLVLISFFISLDIHSESNKNIYESVSHYMKIHHDRF